MQNIKKLFKLTQNIQQASDCLILGVYQAKAESEANEQAAVLPKKLNKSLKSLVGSFIENEKVSGKLGEVHLCYHLQYEGIKRIMLVGMGRFDALNLDLYDKGVKAAIKALSVKDYREISVYFDEDLLTLRGQIRQWVQSYHNVSYQFLDLKTTDTDKAMKGDYEVIQSIHLIAADTHHEDVQQADIVGRAQSHAKNLQNTPPNICNPDSLVAHIKQMCQTHTELTLEVLDAQQLEKMGAGCLLAVGQGSRYGSYLVSMSYKGAQSASEAPYILVGKGVTFDTGGICLKPRMGMDTMKMDMSGAAAVIAVMQAVVELKLPINVVGVVALVENSIDANAMRPSDVVTSLSGKTVEILNTDAEGRLILADALTYVEKHNPKAVIDVATLTGAMVVALGDYYTGFFSNDDDLVAALKVAAQKSNDAVWHLPLAEAYKDCTKSKVADLSHFVGDPAAGSMKAAIFLSEFSKKYPWAHLDVAGSAMGNFNNAVASGRPVPLLLQYLMDCAQKQTK